MIALFVALSSTGVAASIVPLAEACAEGRQGKTANTANKAKVATNALKLNGQTAEQIAAIPGPAADAATLERPDGGPDRSHARPDELALRQPVHASLGRLEHPDRGRQDRRSRPLRHR